MWKTIYVYIFIGLTIEQRFVFYYLYFNYLQQCNFLQKIYLKK